MKIKFKFFKKKKDFRKKTSIINPNIYWNYILYSTFTLIVLAFVFGFWLFIKTNKELPTQAGDTSAQIGIVKKERTEKVLDYFSKLEQKSRDIINSNPPVVDPSL